MLIFAGRSASEPPFFARHNFATLTYFVGERFSYALTVDQVAIKLGVTNHSHIWRFVNFPAAVSRRRSNLETPHLSTRTYTRCAPGARHLRTDATRDAEAVSRARRNKISTARNRVAFPVIRAHARRTRASGMFRASQPARNFRAIQFSRVTRIRDRIHSTAVFLFPDARPSSTRSKTVFRNFVLGYARARLRRFQHEFHDRAVSRSIIRNIPRIFPKTNTLANWGTVIRWHNVVEFRTLIRW